MAELCAQITKTLKEIFSELNPTFTSIPEAARTRVERFGVDLRNENEDIRIEAVRCLGGYLGSEREAEVAKLALSLISEARGDNSEEVSALANRLYDSFQAGDTQVIRNFAATSVGMAKDSAA